MLPVATDPRAFRLHGVDGVRVVLAEAGLACCTLEVESAVSSGLLVPQDVDRPDDSGGDRVVLLVSGTVTDALAPAVAALHDDLVARGATVAVLAVGACASTGGPYWDAPTVTAGIDRVLPTAGYVPGCPPTPAALVSALHGLAVPDSSLAIAAQVRP